MFAKDLSKGAPTQPHPGGPKEPPGVPIRWDSACDRRFDRRLRSPWRCAVTSDAGCAAAGDAQRNCSEAWKTRRTNMGLPPNRRGTQIDRLRRRCVFHTAWYIAETADRPIRARVATDPLRWRPMQVFPRQSSASGWTAPQRHGGTPRESRASSAAGDHGHTGGGAENVKGSEGVWGGAPAGLGI